MCKMWLWPLGVIVWFNQPHRCEERHIATHWISQIVIYTTELVNPLIGPNAWCWVSYSELLLRRTVMFVARGCEAIGEKKRQILLSRFRWCCYLLRAHFPFASKEYISARCHFWTARSPKIENNGALTLQISQDTITNLPSHREQSRVFIFLLLNLSHCHVVRHVD